MSHDNLLAGPAPVELPDDFPDVRTRLAAGDDPAAVAAGNPASSLAWAALAERVLAAGDGAGDTPGDGAGNTATAPVAAYAYARTGYHRGLDALRRAGWRGQGPIPAAHVPNQGFLRALLALSEAAALIGEAEERDRCRQFLVDSGSSADEVRALVVAGR
ncbi:DUF3151 domain-containing protein [Myceligenerans pegani]|uniref:DUF3151 domain-containing protein n=1 Tax=Myceligenerans pegani TaxID=2776917 RepID=A0ABR9MSR7_9MICO|nr:DUF3151 domain-containing protein [Myceligenerans sp. TRM 65318]MBE1874423.1 DUF3151 domain-containing protein [Myceligenerans sp. TRM 65318]MBE3016694.1 DUF3151 domain-containing protein [Myceligenerans sp. TRM 65318]